MTGEPIRGSCLCGGVRFELTGMAHLVVRAEHFHLLRGRKLIARYEPQTNAKGFPSAAGALDDARGARPVLHECVADKAPWYENLDGLPQDPGDPPR
jgi:hypothetical protein